MSRPLDHILFGSPSPRAQAVTRTMSVIAGAVLLLLAAGVVFRFHSAGQLDARLWKFFALPTTWSFLAKGLLGTLFNGMSDDARNEEDQAKLRAQQVDRTGQTNPAGKDAVGAATCEASGMQDARQG